MTTTTACPPGELCSYEYSDESNLDTKNDTKEIEIHLKWAKVQVVDRELCKEKFAPIPIPGYDFQENITEQHVCAGNLNGTDSCGGDSGGPLICIDNGKAVLSGIVSFGRGCADTSRIPGVYANVAYLLDWVKQNMVTHFMIRF